MIDRSLYGSLHRWDGRVYKLVYPMIANGEPTWQAFLVADPDAVPGAPTYSAHFIAATTKDGEPVGLPHAEGHSIMVKQSQFRAKIVPQKTEWVEVEE